MTNPRKKIDRSRLLMTDDSKSSTSKAASGTATVTALLNLNPVALNANHTAPAKSLKDASTQTDSKPTQTPEPKAPEIQHKQAVTPAYEISEEERAAWDAHEHGKMLPF